MRKRILISLVVFTVSLVAVTATNLLANSRPSSASPKCLNCYKRYEIVISLEKNRWEVREKCNSCKGRGEHFDRVNHRYIRCSHCEGRGYNIYVWERLFCPRCGHVEYEHPIGKY